MKSTFSQNAFNLGEVSPRALGRYDSDRPIWKYGLARCENFLNFKIGGALFWPGTQYIAEVKTSSKKVRLEPFQYSITQSYILEIGDLYMRFFANKGQVISGTPVEIVTPFAVADIFSLQFANKADVDYIIGTTSSGIGYVPQKLVRNSATSFGISSVNFIRGPFLPQNITTTTITPSAATGAGITLTASTAIFKAGHVGSLWRVNSSATVGAVVKITAFTNTTHVVGDVQPEPDGVAGDIGGTGGYTNWAEGAFSDVRGWPRSVTFHEQRLVYGGTFNNPSMFWASAIGEYDNYDVGSSGDSDAYSYEINSDSLVPSIRFMSSNTALAIGTSSGTFSATSSAGGVGITPTSISVTQDTDYSVFALPPKKISSFLYYLSGSGFNMRQLVFSLELNKQRSEDMTQLADHILRDGGGPVQMAKQQSPNERIWVVRADGQIAVVTREAEAQILAWGRRIAGSSSGSSGIFESVAILTQDGGDDQVWVVVKRTINGSVKRYVELFTDELFTNYYDPIRLDCSLTLDTPITISGATKANPVVITATAHGLSNGDQIKIDNVVGMTNLNTNIYYVANAGVNTFELNDSAGATINGTAYSTYISGGQVRKMVTAISGLDHLNGETVSVMSDGGLPAAQQTYTVSGGAITLAAKAAVVHVGLPYTGKLQLLPLGDGSMTGTGQSKLRKIYASILRVHKSLGGKISFVDQYGNETTAMPIIYPTQTPQLPAGHSPIPYSGDLDITPDADYTKYASLLITQDVPLPLFILSIILLSESYER